jgi:hypothetical protein
LGRFVQADSIVPAGAQGLDRYVYVNNSPINWSDPTGHDPWWCDDTQCETLYNNRTLNRDQVQILIEVFKAMDNLDYDLSTPKGREAGIKFVVGAECDGETCDPANPQLFQAMSHRYNEFCADDPFGARCLVSFWGYPQPILDAARDPNTIPGNMAKQSNVPTNDITAAILGGHGASYGGFTNDGRGCFGSDKNQLCGWGNLNKYQASDFRNEFFSWDEGCVDRGRDCNLVGPSSYSVWLHYQTADTYFIVMDFIVDLTYCGAGWCEH